jgi:hypothetical protein
MIDGFLRDMAPGSRMILTSAAGIGSIRSDLRIVTGFQGEIHDLGFLNCFMTVVVCLSFSST